jgi:hypothetical protein
MEERHWNGSYRHCMKRCERIHLAHDMDLRWAVVNTVMCIFVRDQLRKYRVIEKSLNHTKIFIDGFKWIQFSIQLINKHKISLQIYNSPRRSRDGVTRSRQSVSCLSTVEVQGCLFREFKECSLSNTTCHLVLNYLARVSLETHLAIFLCQTNLQYLVW